MEKIVTLLFFQSSAIICGMKQSFDTHHSQRGFFSIHLLAIIVGILLVTGAGQYLWHHALQLGSYCQSAVAEMEIYELSDTCMSIGTAMASLKNSLSQMVGETKWGDSMDLEEFSAMVAQQFSSGYGFSAPSLSGLTGSSGSALSLGSLGSQNLSSGNTDMGLKYLQKSASMGDSGLLSQLSLGSAYGSGSGGVKLDLNASRYYNSQALDSITRLQSSSAPEAKQILQALPASPDAVAASLRQALGR